MTETDNYSPSPQSEPDRNARDWGMFCHVAAFAGLVVPLGNIIAPLVIWLMKREHYPFVDYNGKEVLNFQITMLIACLISSILTLILIGFLLLAVLCIFFMIVTIIAIIKSSRGEYYRYPFCIRFIQ